MTDTSKRISDYVESIAMENFCDIIDDVNRTEQLIGKLCVFKDQAEDKKIQLKRSIASKTHILNIELIQDDIAECNKIIKKINDDISYVRTASTMYVFYKKAREILPKDLLKKLEAEVNSHMLINKVSVGDELTCIIPCDDIGRNAVCKCSNIDKFNNKIAVKGRNGYHSINNFRLNTTKV